MNGVRLSTTPVPCAFSARDTFVSEPAAVIAGLPVVAKAQTGIREFVAHEQEGLLAANDAEMARELTRIVNDRTLRERIAKHNRTTPSPVDWTDVVERNVEAYRLAISLQL